MISKLLKNEYKKLVYNFISLSSINLANLILPLVVIPHLVSSLGIAKYGILMFSQAIISYLNEFVEFGFRYSATRCISINRNDRKMVNSIFSSVFYAKMILVLIGFGIISILTYIIPQFNEVKSIIFISFILVIGNALFPEWLFLGMERMKFIAIINVLTKILFTISIFFIVDSPKDLELSAFLFSGSFLITGFISLVIAIKVFSIHLTKPNLKNIIHYLSDSYSFFVARLSAVIYGSTNPIILGFFVSNEAVGIYSIAEKLYFAIVRSYQAIANTLYPYMSHKRNINLFNKIFIVVIIFHVVASIVLYINSELIIETISNAKSNIAEDIFHIFLVTSLFTVISIMITYPFLAAMGYKKYANNSSIVAMIFNIIIIGVLYITKNINIYSVSYTLMSTEFLVSIIVIIGYFRFRRI